MNRFVFAGGGVWPGGVGAGGTKEDLELEGVRCMVGGAREVVVSGAEVVIRSERGRARLHFTMVFLVGREALLDGRVVASGWLTRWWWVGG